MEHIILNVSERRLWRSVVDMVDVIVCQCESVVCMSNEVVLCSAGGNEVRSCIDEIEEARCISEIIGGERYKTCYCNTERCNSSSQAFLSLSLLLATSLLHLLR